SRHEFGKSSPRQATYLTEANLFNEHRSHTHVAHAHHGKVGSEPASLRASTAFPKYGQQQTLAQLVQPRPVSREQANCAHALIQMAGHGVAGGNLLARR